MRSEVRGQRALATSTLAIDDRDDRHAMGSRVAAILAVRARNAASRVERPAD
jgi:hypothetical protein